MTLKDIHIIYFIGIGGIGMSALARYFKGLGVQVYGYDKTETALTKKLVNEGMHIHYEDRPQDIPNQVDLVVFTPAVPETLRELQYFRAQGYPVKKRSEVLGIISRGMKTAAIAGTHGKTTTSSMLTHLLHTGGVDCTAFLGGIAQNFNSNFVSGKSEWVVVEADEYDRSFLQLSPDIAVILSMEPDHLDIYGDEQSILETGFMAFADKRKPGGTLWANETLIAHFADHKGIRSFGVEQGTCRAEKIRVENGCFVFDYWSPEVVIRDIQLALPGRHNVENATAATSVALQIGISAAHVREALATFKGIRRRFELIYKDEATVFIDDYAHHPSELKAAIGAARELYPGRKLSGVFQPHLFSRTRDFAAGFAEALDQLDELFLLDIYPARERPIEGVNARIISDKMKHCSARQLVAKEELIDCLSEGSFDILMTLGAGDIDRFVQPIARLLKEKQQQNDRH